MPFGLKVLQLLPDLLGSDLVPMDGDVLIGAGLATFEAKSWNDWSEARVGRACRYVRGSIHLRVPFRWKEAFPTCI